MYFQRLVDPDCSISAFQIRITSSVSGLLNFEEVGATSQPGIYLGGKWEKSDKMVFFYKMHCAASQAH